MQLISGVRKRVSLCAYTAHTHKHTPIICVCVCVCISVCYSSSFVLMSSCRRKCCAFNLIVVKTNNNNNLGNWVNSRQQCSTHSFRGTVLPPLFFCLSFCLPQSLFEHTQCVRKEFNNSTSIAIMTLKPTHTKRAQAAPRERERECSRCHGGRQWQRTEGRGIDTVQ